MRFTVFPLSSLILAAALGCHAQVQEASAKLPAETARRIEVLIRSRSSVPPGYTVNIGSRVKSDFPGYDAVTVTFVSNGRASQPTVFLLSIDGKTLAQFTKFDIGKDPKDIISGADRPARGGALTAPVSIVVFDDLECPFCARMHQQLFPAVLDRYKDQVHVVYRDYPLPQHPWAMHAAIDANCVGTRSTPGYWNYVDYIHGHADELGGAEKSLPKANEKLDSLAAEEGKRQSVNADELKSCIAKQDDAAIKASMKMAESLNVEATPALFINGEKIDGAVPITDVYRAVDSALVAAGQTPPPPVVSSTPPAAAAKPAAPANQ